MAHRLSPALSASCCWVILRRIRQRKTHTPSGALMVTFLMVMSVVSLAPPVPMSPSHAGDHEAAGVGHSDRRPSHYCRRNSARTSIKSSRRDEAEIGADTALRGYPFRIASE